MEKFSGANFCFFGVSVGLVFLGGVLLMFFALCFDGSLPKLFGKILLMSGLVFLVFSLFFWFLTGLELARPFQSPFWTRGGKGVSLLLVAGFCFPLLFRSCARFTKMPTP